MKQTKSIYLFAGTSNLDSTLCAKDLQYKYNIIGNSKNITEFYGFKESSVDYLIIFANRKRFSNLDKHKLNYLNHVFNNIVVVSKTKLNVLKDYIFIPKKLVGNSLYKILKLLESGIKTGLYTFDNFYNVCSKLLNQLNFNIKHKGYGYIVECAYNIATINKKGNLKLLYSSLASKYNTTSSAVERCIRVAINSAIANNRKGSLQNNQTFTSKSNKKFIEALNAYVINNLM